MEPKFKIGDRVICRTGMHHMSPNSEHECVVKEINAGSGYTVERISDGNIGWFGEDNMRLVK